jgi:hypothetical protein
VTGLRLNFRAQLAIGDFDNDGLLDIIAVGDGGTRLFRNVTQKGFLTFQEVTKQSNLASVGGTSVAFVPRGGKARTAPDLIVGCLHGANRYFTNDGHGAFKEATADVGLDRRIFNTRGLAVLPSANGNADVVMLNEGQPSSVLLWKK